VNFVADSNPGKTGLPPASPLLQLPGQTHDIKVTWAPGRYYFHCDPHALLGMKGWLEVEDEN
jgi:plastocyanin